LEISELTIIKPNKHVKMLNTLFLKGLGKDFVRQCSHRTLSIFLMLSFFLPLIAQEKTVTGVVTSATDQSPLLGVSVRVKGSNNGTSTDQDGRFSIAVPENAVLEFSFIAFLPEEVVVGSRTNLQVVLRADNRSMEEVIVVGYGTARKSEITA